MKNYFNMLVAAAALASVLTGCGKTSDETSVKTKGAKSSEVAVEACVSAAMTNDIEGMLEIAVPGAAETLSEGYRLIGDKFIEKISLESGASAFEGNPSCKVEVTSCEFYGTDYLSWFNQVASAKGYDMADDIVEATFNITVDDHFAQEKGLNTSTVTGMDGVYALHINGKWYAMYENYLEETTRYWAREMEY